jgi:hypothetical protein
MTRNLLVYYHLSNLDGHEILINHIKYKFKLALFKWSSIKYTQVPINNLCEFFSAKFIKFDVFMTFYS